MTDDLHPSAPPSPDMDHPADGIDHDDPLPMADPPRVEPEHQTVDDVGTVNLTFGEWVRWRFLGQDVVGELYERLNSLDNAIRQHPNAPSNYLLRGELLLKLRQVDDAKHDLQRAAELAQAEYETNAWGIMAQGVRDQALRRLEGVERYR